ncbi:hypothetical protein Bca4012_091693 [Brassica carinata]|uniref:Reverse transcriptase zinc-binding domain-containing protein n=1 Tax=Brassica carinata TaxID=52824 RepID=A0A8X7TUR9_BRACI|nr:hypothetical protein Bca52824_074431 [Brassica carinata]
MSSPVLGPDTWNWKKNIWSPPLLPKLKFFLWKVALNALPTGDNLQKKGLLINTNCARCGGTESIYHILVHCTFAKEVWEVGPWLHQLNPLHFVNFKELLKASHTWNLNSPVVHDLFHCDISPIGQLSSVYNTISSFPNHIFL